MKTRILGYCIIVAIICALSGLAGYGVYTLATPKLFRVIAFDFVGNISTEDPVSYNGFQIGKVAKLEGDGTRILVTVEFSKPIKIYSDYQIVTLDKGLMGDRLITLYPGSSASPEIPVTDTLGGMFFAGVSEMLGKVWILEKAITDLAIMAVDLSRGTDSTESFTEKYLSVSREIDSASARIATAVKFLNSGLPENLNKINRTIHSTRKTINTVGEKAGPALLNLDAQISQLEAVAVKLDSIATGLDTLIAGIEKSKILSDADIVTDISKKLSEMRKLADEARKGESKIKLRISRLRSRELSPNP
jgi:phospholipid/cholesterol/gamma-HCH transport system substrate-binding protein